MGQVFSQRLKALALVDVGRAIGIASQRQNPRPKGH